MKNIYLLLHIVTWDGWTKNLTKFQSEGRMVHKRLTPKPKRVILNAFERWLVSSNRGLWQFRRANNNISKGIRIWFWWCPVRYLRRVIQWPILFFCSRKKTTDIRGVIRNRIVYIIDTDLWLTAVPCDIIKLISLISSGGNKPYEDKFEWMNEKTEATWIHYHHIATRLGFPSWVDAIFGIWYLKLSSTDTPTRFACKKYLIQQIIFERVLTKMRLEHDSLKTTHTPAHFRSASDWVEIFQATLLHPSSLDSNGVQGLPATYELGVTNSRVWS